MPKHIFEIVLDDEEFESFDDLYYMSMDEFQGTKDEFGRHLFFKGFLESRVDAKLKEREELEMFYAQKEQEGHHHGHAGACHCEEGDDDCYCKEDTKPHHHHTHGEPCHCGEEDDCYCKEDSKPHHHHDEEAGECSCHLELDTCECGLE